MPRRDRAPRSFPRLWLPPTRAPQTHEPQRAAPTSAGPRPPPASGAGRLARGRRMSVIVPLELTGLTKVFPTPAGPFVAVKDVNLRVQPSEFVCIVGHSGCGKSTVLSII